MKVIKDLLYTTDNENLDISRLCSLFGVLTYLAGTAYTLITESGAFDYIAWGGGWTALCAGCAGWIYARQKWEVEAIAAKNPAKDSLPAWQGYPGYSTQYGPPMYGPQPPHG